MPEPPRSPRHARRRKAEARADDTPSLFDPKASSDASGRKGSPGGKRRKARRSRARARQTTWPLESPGFPPFLAPLLLSMLAGFICAALIFTLAPLFLSRPSENTRVARLWQGFDAQRVLGDIRTLCAIQPRHSGSEGSLRVREFIRAELAEAGWRTDEQRFRGRGDLRHVNLIAHTTLNLARRPRLLLATHYDGPRNSQTALPGAAGSAAGIAILLEAARHLERSPADSVFVEVAFFDANEPLEQFAPDDGLAGARFYAQHLGAAKPIEAALLLGTAGGRDASLTILPHSSPELARDLSAVVGGIGLSLEFQMFNRRVWSAQLPFGVAKIRSLAITCAGDPAVRTADDTPDRIDVRAVETLGRTLLAWVQSRLTAPTK